MLHPHKFTQCFIHMHNWWQTRIAPIVEMHGGAGDYLSQMHWCVLCMQWSTCTAGGLQITSKGDSQAPPPPSPSFIQCKGAPVLAGWACFGVWGSFNEFV